MLTVTTLRKGRGREVSSSAIEVARLKSWSRQFHREEGRRGKLQFPRKLDVTLLLRGVGEEEGRMLTNEESRENPSRRKGRGVLVVFLFLVES